MYKRQELERVSQIGAKTLVLHPGSHVGAGMDVGIEWIINCLLYTSLEKYKKAILYLAIH